MQIYSSDKVYIARRKGDDRYEPGDESISSIACDECKTMVRMRRGDVRDRSMLGTVLQCGHCLERQARYRDLVAAKEQKAALP